MEAGKQTVFSPPGSLPQTAMVYRPSEVRRTEASCDVHSSPELNCMSVARANGWCWTIRAALVSNIAAVVGWRARKILVDIVAVGQTETGVGSAASGNLARGSFSVERSRR